MNTTELAKRGSQIGLKVRKVIRDAMLEMCRENIGVKPQLEVIEVVIGTVVGELSCISTQDMHSARMQAERFKDRISESVEEFSCMVNAGRGEKKH